MPEGTAVRPSEPADRANIVRIWRASLEAGELTGIHATEIDQLIERLDADDRGIFVATLNDRMAGFLYALPRVVVVAPAFRRQGIGRQLVEHAEAALAAGGESLLLWLPENNEAAAAFRDALGFRYRESLWEMALRADLPIAAPMFPPEIEPRSVDQVEIPVFVAMFNQAFHDHPTPLQVTEELVEWTHARPGFDPAMILVLVERATNALIGMSKISIEGDHGEIDLIGVVPAWRGHGLGRALLHWGITSLRHRGATTVTLRVAGDNANALALYERVGFMRTFEWRRFGRTDPPGLRDEATSSV